MIRKYKKITEISVKIDGRGELSGKQMILFMKKDIVVLLIAGTFFLKSVRGEAGKGLQSKSFFNVLLCQSDTVVQMLGAMNFSQYHNQPVDTLLSHLPHGSIQMKIMGWHNLRTADVLYVSYPNNVFVAIFVTNFRFMNPNGSGNNPPNRDWDISLFRKEDIGYVVAYNDNQCINGCEYQYK